MANACGTAPTPSACLNGLNLEPRVGKIPGFELCNLENVRKRGFAVVTIAPTLGKTGRICNSLLTRVMRHGLIPWPVILTSEPSLSHRQVCGTSWVDGVQWRAGPGP
jgi:hypothetical protein